MTYDRPVDPFVFHSCHIQPFFQLILPSVLLPTYYILIVLACEDPLRRTWRTKRNLCCVVDIDILLNFHVVHLPRVSWLTGITAAPHFIALGLSESNIDSFSNGCPQASTPLRSSEVVFAVLRPVPPPGREYSHTRYSF